MPNRNTSGSLESAPFSRRAIFIILRRVFNLLYHQFAWTYDWVAAIVSLGAWHGWVLSLLPYLDGPRILEIGSGPGHLQVALHQQGIATYGLDESKQMIRIAQKKLATLMKHPGLVRGNAYFLPFADASFQQVVMTFPSEFILYPDTFNEINRVLSDAGQVLILPMAWITGQKPVERFAAWVNRITGEAPEFHERSLEWLKNLGFNLSWEIKEFPSSKILLIKMEKV